MSELAQELRKQARSLLQKYNMDRATDELRQRLDQLLSREEQTLKRNHGYESQRMNEFLERRHGEAQRVSDRDRALLRLPVRERASQGEYDELKQELERLRALEEFLKQNAEREARDHGPERLRQVDPRLRADGPPLVRDHRGRDPARRRERRRGGRRRARAEGSLPRLPVPARDPRRHRHELPPERDQRDPEGEGRRQGRPDPGQGVPDARSSPRWSG